jgi:hypothetical protein
MRILLLLLLASILCASCLEEERVIVLHPSGGDDGPIISAALLFGPVKLTAGQFSVRTPIAVPSGANLTAGPNTTIYSDLTGSGPGGYEQSTFYAAATVREYRSALLSAAVQGLTSIETITPPEPGTWIRVSNPLTQNVAQVFRVVSVRGTTVNLDRPVQYARAFRALSLVEGIDPPRDIRLSGNGATIIGTGDRAFELSATQRSIIRGWNVQGLFQSIVISFDIGSADSVILDVFVDGGMAAAAGVALESCYRCAIHGAIVRNTLRGSSNPGVYVVDSVDAVVVADVEDCGVGVQVASGSTNDPTAAGSRNVTISGRFDRSVHFGAQITTPDIEIRDASFSSNHGIGINVDFGADRNRPSGGPLLLSDVSGHSNGGPLLVLRGGSVVAERLVSRNDGFVFQNRAIEIRPGSATLELTGSNLILEEDRPWWGLYTAGSGSVSIDSSGIALPAGPRNKSAGIVVGSDSFTRVSNTTISGGHFGIYVFGNGGTLDLGDDVTIDSVDPVVVNDGSTLLSAGP